MTGLETLELGASRRRLAADALGIAVSAMGRQCEESDDWSP